ncbi:MAG: protein kinase domain-containing protein [Pyrinomonadaceae bacterium]
MALSPNTHLGRYEIRSQIGAGGMGEVYLALDAQLNRTVALKILPTEVLSNGERMRRFVQEARAAAALSHPNIAHIYEVGESEGTHFIAMEFIDGETLREEIHTRKTPLTKLLKYLTQVAQGLAKAHAAGIVHRDLKPDNIMIARDGYAKILDFGLAKLIEPQLGSDSGSSEVATAILMQHSTPGMIMGTVGYMSPEQAQGRVNEIDHRSDIFSFGCILYEAATGRKAFEGKDVLDSLHMIVHAPTPQIRDVNADAPNEMQRIVRRCLAKEPEKRYQSIKEVAIELDELRQELKDKAELEYSVQPESSSLESVSASQQVKINSTQHLAVNTTQTEIARSTSSAEYVVSEIKSHKRAVGIAVIALLLAIGGVLFALYKFGWLERSVTTSAPFQAMKITKLTSNGKATSAVISPDGKQVFYVIDDAGRRSLWLRQIATATDVQLRAPEDTFYIGLTISPDSNFLYYASRGASVLNRGLYKMPVVGGNPRRVVDDVGSPISFSPDGRQIAFVRNGEAESALMIANADGTQERKIAIRQRGASGSFGNFFQGGTAWSPDGKKVASIALSIETGRGFQNVVEVPVEGGTERPLTSQSWYQIQRLAWLADGSGLLMTAAEQAADFQATQIWYLSYPSGEARKITNDLKEYQNISLNADSSILVTVQADRDANIWVAPNGDASRATQLTSVSSGKDGSIGVAWTPHGQIVYHAMAGGKEGIWIMEADGNNRRQLTTGETVDFFPSVSADGRYVVFVSERMGRRGIWRMDIDGSNPKHLTDRGNYPQATAEWVIYQTARGLWKVSINGGEPVRLGENMVWNAISPDGKLIAYALNTPLPGKLAVISIEGGSPVQVFDVQPNLPARIRWTPDGRAVTYVASQNGISDIWSQPLDGGESKKLTNFKSDRIFSFDWSRDNKLVISHGTAASDIVLIRNAK